MGSNSHAATPLEPGGERHRQWHRANDDSKYAEDDGRVS